MTSNCDTFSKKKNFKKVWQFRTFTQKVPFLDYNKTKKEKGKQFGKKVWQFGKKCDNLRSWTVLKKRVPTKISVNNNGVFGNFYGGF